MLRIGKLTDYAMLIMSQMARQPDLVLSATVLAEGLHLPLPTVSKILKMLSEAKLVNSIRGAEGGYHLARSARTITVTDVIAAMEGEMAMTECCEKISTCTITASCSMRQNWRKINKKIKTMLGKLTILDMSLPLSLGVLSHEK